MDTHHIIGDGLSTPVLLQRLDQAYGEGSLRTEWNYYDYLYTLKQAEGETGAKSRDLKYWVEHLNELPEPLVLPGDHVRPKRFDYQGKEYELMLTEAEKEACELCVTLLVCRNVVAIHRREVAVELYTCREATYRVVYLDEVV